jgi:hypothetical protein
MHRGWAPTMALIIPFQLLSSMIRSARPTGRFLRVNGTPFREMLKDHLYPGAHAAHALPASLELLG